MSIPLRVLVEAYEAMRQMREAGVAATDDLRRRLASAEGALGYYVQALLAKERVEVKEEA